MGMLNQLLTNNSSANSSADVAAAGPAFIEGLYQLVLWILLIAGTLFTLYAVYIGYLFATASDEGKRKAAKTRLMKVLSSALIIYALTTSIKLIEINFSNTKKSGNTNDTNDIIWDNTLLVYHCMNMPTLQLSDQDGTPCIIRFEAKNVMRKKADGNLEGVQNVRLTDINLFGLDEVEAQMPPSIPIKTITNEGKNLSYSFYFRQPQGNSISTVTYYAKDKAVS